MSCTNWSFNRYKMRDRVYSNLARSNTVFQIIISDVNRVHENNRSHNYLKKYGNWFDLLRQTKYTNNYIAASRVLLSC